MQRLTLSEYLITILLLLLLAFSAAHFLQSWLLGVTETTAVRMEARQ